MKDIKIDFVNDKILDEYIEGKDRIVQQIIVACRSWLGDFFLNEDFGVDYDNSWSNDQIMSSSIRQQIEAIPDVESVNKVSVVKSKDSRDEYKFTVNAEIVYNNEIFSISKLFIY